MLNIYLKRIEMNSEFCVASEWWMVESRIKKQETRAKAKILDTRYEIPDLRC